MKREWRRIEEGFSAEFVLRWGDEWQEALINDLVQAGVLPLSKPSSVCYEDLEPWWRGGGETYCSTFMVSSTEKVEGAPRHVICKAAVGSTGNLTAKVCEWLSRAQQLHLCGVSTGTYGVSRGSIFQEYLVDSFLGVIQEAAWNSDGHKLLNMGGHFGRLVRRVENAGFSPITLAKDIRIKNYELYIVDLGADLGGFVTDRPGSARKAAEIDIDGLPLAANVRHLMQKGLAIGYLEANYESAD
jgi:hypothetical protein